MNITIRRNFGFELIIEADNVKITEDIEERTYQKDGNGKVIVNLNPERDVKEEYIDLFVSPLSDMIYYRKKPYDSSDLIEQLFDKLPPGKTVIDLLEKLNRQYT